MKAMPRKRRPMRKHGAPCAPAAKVGFGPRKPRREDFPGCGSPSPCEKLLDFAFGLALACGGRRLLFAPDEIVGLVAAMLRVSGCGRGGLDLFAELSRAPVPEHPRLSQRSEVAERGAVAAERVAGVRDSVGTALSIVAARDHLVQRGHSAAQLDLANSLQALSPAKLVHRVQSPR